MRLPRASLRTNCLKSERFQFCRPGARTAPYLRSPQVPAAGAANEAGLNHSLTAFGYEIGATRSGRLAASPLKMLATFWPLTLMLSGAPVIAVTMPDSCHPPTVVLRNLFELFRRTGM